MHQMRQVYDEYPRQFWLLMGASFIDRVGGALLFPFLSLYIIVKFDVGVTQVGHIFGIFALTSIGGNIVGGALTDKLGRKKMVIFGLISSAATSLLFGIVTEFEMLYPLAAIVGIFSSMGGPAQQAMVADILPEEQRTEGYAVWRIIANVAVTIGPMIGGLMAGVSYMLLFATDAVTSLITATLVYLYLNETKPAQQKNEDGTDKTPETISQTLRGYGLVLRDMPFMIFAVVMLLVELVYFQMNSTLAIFLHDVHEVPEQGFGLIISMNAAMVVLMQFWISRRIKRYPPLLVMFAGTMLYAIGFGMYGFVSTFGLFLVAMAVITLGEMFIAPVGQSLVAKFAPEDMRGRYMAIFAFSFIIPAGVGVMLAGLIMDNSDPRMVWYVAGVVGTIAALGFLVLHANESKEPEPSIQPAPEVAL